MSYTRANAFYLFPALSGTLALVAWHHYSERESLWEKNAIGFAEDLRFDTALWALAFITFVTLPAMLISGFSPQKALKSTRHFSEPQNPNAAQVGNALGLESGSAGVRSTGNPGTLPRQHLLGSGPELSKQIVMLIQVSGELTGSPPSHPRFYWRSQDYDLYTGHGWLTSAANPRDYRAGQPVWSPDPGAFQVIEQTIQQVGPSGVQIYQNGTIVSADQPFELQWRADYPPDNPPDDPQQPDIFTAQLRSSAPRWGLPGDFGAAKRRRR